MHQLYGAAFQSQRKYPSRINGGSLLLISYPALRASLPQRREQKSTPLLLREKQQLCQVFDPSQ
jgi:hypothetical protein